MREKRQQLIRTVAADDPRWIEAIASADRLSKRGRGAVWIEFKAVGMSFYRIDRPS